MNKQEIKAKLHNYEERLKDVAKAIGETRKQLAKDWDKPFENWESKPAYRHAIQIVIKVFEGGIFFGNSGDGATFDLENITEIHSKLGHAIAELKRKQ